MSAAVMESMSDTARLALETLLGQPTRGIPTRSMNVMEHAQIERLGGSPPGSYVRDPEATYLRCVRGIGACNTDQYIPLNPLSMAAAGYDERTERRATTGADEVVVDGLAIGSPEAVVDHMERFTFPALERRAAGFDEDARVAEIIDGEREIQEKVGPDMLKTGYGFVTFPTLSYGTYGYVNYFCAYALYPEVMERHFSLQADLCELKNRAAARAYAEGGLPPLYRLDHDMADSRSTLVDIRSLDRIWFPHFARALEPMLKTDVSMVWHCDGNLMQMVPRLLEVGLRGFQGFQYEDGMDYEKICRMKSRDGGGLIIMAGVSVTTTLPKGTPSDVRKQLDWLVEAGPRTGLFLGASSSITPGVPAENLDALVEGLRHYREHGRE